MDLDEAPDDRAFRDEARTWLRAHVPREVRPDAGAAMREFDLGWQRTQFDGGWAGISWPAEHGGRGLSLLRQMIWLEEYALAEGPYVGCCYVGINHGGPTLVAWGTDEQQRQHLLPILRGDVVWCQGFSEPDAGSDLAGLRTRGEVDGDHLVVTGQKIWTSYGHLAEYQELLVRTDPDDRYGGMTWAICDMRSPGIDVRPITSMARGDHFCEVFYDHVRIPLADVVGGIGRGWEVARTTLSVERGTGFIAEQVELARTVEHLLDLARARSGGSDLAGHPLAERLAMARAEVTALRTMTLALVSRLERSPAAGPEGSLVRLYHSELVQRVGRLALEVLGSDRLRFRRWGLDDGWTGAWLRSFSATIAGGTSDIHRNLVGERVLGLPRGRPARGVERHVNLLPDDDQQALVDAADELLADRFPRRRLLGPGGGRVDDATWQELAGLGWLGLGLPVEIGGTGLGAAEESLVAVALGRHLAPVPLLATALAAHAAHATDAVDLAAALAAGGLRAGLLVPASEGAAVDHVVDAPPPAAAGATGLACAWVLDPTGGGPALTPAAELEAVEAVDCVDPAVDLVAVRRGSGGGTPLGAALRARAATLVAAYQVGVAEAALDESCRYARERQQYGQPIGAFQAVKHRCADMAARLEAARSITAVAALLVDRGDATAPFHAATAKALADAAARANAAANVQNHGGIGFTWEHGAHLLASRAEVLSQVALPTRDALAEVLAAPTPAG